MNITLTPEETIRELYQGVRVCVYSCVCVLGYILLVISFSGNCSESVCVVYMNHMCVGSPACLFVFSETTQSCFGFFHTSFCSEKVKVLYSIFLPVTLFSSTQCPCARHRGTTVPLLHSDSRRILEHLDTGLVDIVAAVWSQGQ